MNTLSIITNGVGGERHVTSLRFNRREFRDKDTDPFDVLEIEIEGIHIQIHVAPGGRITCQEPTDGDINDYQ